MEREGMVFYRSWIEAIKNLPREMQGEVLTAILEYGLYGETTESLKPITNAMLAMVKPQIDSNNIKYENGKKGAEHGKKGGRPPKNANPNETPQKPQENPNETPKEKENDKVNDNNSLSLPGEVLVFPPTGIFEKSLSECQTELSSNQTWAETTTMNIRNSGYKDFTLETFYWYLKEYFAEMQNRGITNKSSADAMSHFASWLRKELKEQKDGKRSIRTDSKPPADTQSGGEAQKDYSRKF